MNCQKIKDPFWDKPIRTSKGGGTKCTTCEVRQKCHECCTCVWPYICVTYNINCEEIIVLNLDPNLRAIKWDCDNQKYDLSFSCGDYVIDMSLTYEKINNICYAKLKSEFLGLTNGDEKIIEFSESSNCKCPVWDFYLSDNYNELIQIRPYDFVSIGHQRCINKGPEDCTYGRCLPRNLCAKVSSSERPLGQITTLKWYESNLIEVDCCCNANFLPEILIARFVTFDSPCEAIAPPKYPTIYSAGAPSHGHVLDDAGAIIHLRHKVASDYDYYVNNYPFVSDGSHVWESEGVVYPFDVEQIVEKSIDGTDLPEDYIPLVYARMIIWCDKTTKEWKSAVEIINATDAQIAGNQDWINTPYQPSNRNTNVHTPPISILSCNPFHLKVGGFMENNYCYDNDGVAGKGLIEIHVQEFVGWVGQHPYKDRKITLYSEVIRVAAPPQTVYDCRGKMHISDPSKQETFKSRKNDGYNLSALWPEPVTGGLPGTQFIVYDPTDRQLTAISTYAQPCDGCEQIEPDDPYALTVRTDCCPVKIPKKLYVTAVNENACLCADSVLFEINYDPATKIWSGTGDFCYCDITVEMDCTSFTAGYLFRIKYTIGGITNTEYGAECDPFYKRTISVSPVSCCGSTQALIHLEITE